MSGVVEVSVEKIEHDGPGGGSETGQEPVDPSAERDQLLAEKAELQDRWLRSEAEFQNFKKRVERDRLERIEYAGMEAVRMLLPVLDDFHRALRSDTADKEYAAGVELIYSRFFEALKKLGLEPMDSKGQPFDPQIHHAVDMTETDKAPDHTILEEYQRGYNFKGRLLRPAMVKVAIQPASK
jgi:molecular chaperone GrpE